MKRMKVLSRSSKKSNLTKMMIKCKLTESQNVYAHLESYRNTVVGSVVEDKRDLAECYLLANTKKPEECNWK